MRGIISLSLCLALAGSVAAQTVGSKMVVLRQAPLKVGSETVEMLDLGDRVVVKEVRGEWLWVSAEASGWIHRRHVVPVEHAIAYFTEIIRQNPTQAIPYHFRGFLWHEQGRSAQALADYDQAIRLNPRLAASYIHRATLLTETGHFDRAMADFNRAIELQPDTATFYNNRSALWHKQEDYAQAVEDLDEAIRLDPQFTLAYQHRGYNRAQLGQFEQAVDDYTEAIRLAPKRAAAYKLRADALRLQGQYADAATDLRRAIELDPKEPIPYNTLAWLLATCPDADLRDGDEAVKLARTACELTEWKNGICLDTLAGAYAETGEFEEAIRWQTAALGTKTDNYDTVNAQIRLQLYQEKTPYREELIAGP